MNNYHWIITPAAIGIKMIMMIMKIINKADVENDDDDYNILYLIIMCDCDDGAE